MKQKTTCSDCGFLALRNFFTGSLEEASEEYRRQIDIVIDPIHRRELHHRVPVCLVRASNLREEMKDSKKGTILDCIQKERECHGMTEWQQGYSPKEHLEKNMLKEQREWQQRESRIQREFQQRERKFDRWVMVFMLIAPLAAVLFGYLLQRIFG